MTNPFEALGESASRGAKKRIDRQVKAVRPPMKLSPLEQKLHDQSQQLKRYRAWKKEIRAGLLTGEYAPEITQLLRLLRKIPEPDVIVRFVQNAKWLTNGHKVMRYACFEYIDHVIIRWRVRHGLASFDDGLPEEPDTPFVTIRRLLAKEGV